jgi:hypothetical protein
MRAKRSDGISSPTAKVVLGRVDMDSLAFMNGYGIVGSVQGVLVKKSRMME